ncbi:MAG: DUF2723 domain-containing protein [Bacteroidetes bacterium]|nr:DUF2723 domain-containing protein [Bacteroidota bacterium]
MNFRKTNNLTGWAVFIFAFLVYFLTREAKGSLWDCGEFVACADQLGMPHSPGAPMFVLLGRFFIILFGDNGMTAANAVNTMSAMASGFTILFIFWSITHFARKMYVSAGEQLTTQQLFTVMASGVVGALAYTFSDSFWYSAGEGEVYALSSFFTALVFWLMLKWEHADEKAGADPVQRTLSDRWIVFLFFTMGLSIGVHLLNLLTIPAIVMIYYYRRYKVSTKGAIIAFLIGCLITGIVQVGVIQYSMKAAGQFDIFFTNSLGMPFFYGFAFYFILLAAIIALALRFKESKMTQAKVTVWFALFLFVSALPFIIKLGSGLQFFPLIIVLGLAFAIGYFLKPSALRMIKLALWCYAFIMLGYFMYFTVLIRSNANPGIDMVKVDNPISLVYYLSREQYGEAPLVYGPHFMANYKEDPERPGRVAMQKGEMEYVRGKNKYIAVGIKSKPIYEDADLQVFPRVWDSDNQQGHVDFYADWLNLREYDQSGRQTGYKPPTYGDNMEWFFSYQMGFMYWRYFMWNFSGKQNDIQGYGNKMHGNWISGIPLMDNARLGDQSKMPDALTKSKGHNTLFMLPFLLGIVGCIYQYLRNKKDWVVNFLLFFMTGIAIVFYLNQAGNQPRERDYAYVGSFYAFAIWIGLGVIGFVKTVTEKKDKRLFMDMLIYGGVLTFFITLMSSMPGSGSDILTTSLIATALYLAFMAGITYLLKAISKAGENLKGLNIATTAVCLVIPVVMWNQEWDDHNRSHKTTAPDLAVDYLESCAPNAVLFTFGDNDTYPLWYAQEVEGVRRDIRIINTSLLGIDWYINQLRSKVNNADSVDVIWTPEQVEGHNREYLRYKQSGSPEVFYNLFNIMKNTMGKPKLDPETGRDVGPDSWPISRYFITVDTNAVRQNKTVNSDDAIIPEMRCEIPKSKLDGGLSKSDFAMLNIIASNAENGWKRPIYFTSDFGSLGFGQYLRKDGLSYRLIPVASTYSPTEWTVDETLRQMGLSTQLDFNNTEASYQNLENKYKFGNAGIKGVYYDEENRRHILDIREIFAEAAGDLANKGRKDEATKLLSKLENGIDTYNLPYAMPSRFYGSSHNQTSLILLEAYYKAGNKEMADKVEQALRKDMAQQKAYYEYMRDARPNDYESFKRSEEILNKIYMNALDAIEAKYAPATPAAKPETSGAPGQLKPAADTTKKKDTTKP